MSRKTKQLTKKIMIIQTIYLTQINNIIGIESDIAYHITHQSQRYNHILTTKHWIAQRLIVINIQKDCLRVINQYSSIICHIKKHNLTQRNTFENFDIKRLRCYFQPQLTFRSRFDSIIQSNIVKNSPHQHINSPNRTFRTHFSKDII